MEKSPTIYERMIHLLVVGCHRFAMRIPLNAGLRMAKLFGLAAYFLDAKHRRIALRNLRFAFGREMGEGGIRETARRNFQQFAMTGHEWLRLRSVDDETLSGLVRVEGREHLDAAREKSRSVILLGAHFGNWEYAHLFYASRINRLNFIVRAIDNPLLEKERVRYNDRFGVNILYKENGLRRAIRNLKRGQDLVIFSDRKAEEGEDLPCQFFGKKSSSISLVPSLGRRMGIPIVPLFIVRCEDMVHHRMVFFPELDVGRECPEEKEAVRKATQRQCEVIEQAIRAAPDHWVWIHKRWMRDHPELYPEDVARRKRRRAKRKAEAKKRQTRKRSTGA